MEAVVRKDRERERAETRDTIVEDAPFFIEIARLATAIASISSVPLYYAVTFTICTLFIPSSVVFRAESRKDDRRSRSRVNARMYHVGASSDRP